MTQPAPMEEEPPGGNSGGSTVFSRKIGAFPVWVWMGLSLAVLLAVTNWRKQKSATASKTASSGTLPTTDTASGSTPASLIPQFVNQVYSNPTPPVVNVTTNTTNNIPDDDDPAHPKPPGPNPKPPPTPVPQPKPKPASGQWVTVSPYTSVNPPWNSTLWGIAQHVYGNGALYGKVFAANKTGVMRPDGTGGVTNNPELIHPGDRIWVPA